MIIIKGKPFNFKVASGAWGFEGRGYPAILFGWKAINALFHIPFRKLPGAIALWFCLFREWVLLYLNLLQHPTLAFTTKSLTFGPREGNPLHAWLRRVAGGFVNAVGLANPGIKDWIRFSLPGLRQRGIKPIVSIAPATASDAEYMVELLLRHTDDILAIELSFGCPNTPSAAGMAKHADLVIASVKAAREACKGKSVFFILKLSVAEDWKAIVRKTQAVVDAYELINSVPAAMVTDREPSPLAAFGGGGYSGPMIFGTACQVVRDAQKLTSKPIIGGGGVHSVPDARVMRRLGASAVTIDTWFIDDPLAVREMIREWNEHTVSNRSHA